MHKSQKAATGVLSGDRTQDALHSCAEPTTQLPFQLCSHSLGRFVDWLVRALHLDRYSIKDRALPTLMARLKEIDFISKNMGTMQ